MQKHGMFAQNCAKQIIHAFRLNGTFLQTGAKCQQRAREHPAVQITMIGSFGLKPGDHLMMVSTHLVYMQHEIIIEI